MNDIDFILEYLTDNISNALRNTDKLISADISEIRLRINKPVCVIIKNNSLFLNKHGRITECITDSVIFPSNDDIEQIFLRLCEYSLYNNIDSLKNGYVILSNGCRVGVASSPVYENDKIISVKSISSINIRIPRNIQGVSVPVLTEIYKSYMPSVVVAGAPNSGKTTFLRDLARQVSSGFNGFYKKVAIVDERKEIVPQNNINDCHTTGVNTDVLSGFKKAKGIEIATRTLSPELIVCDEISTSEELESIKFAFSSGVSFALSVHIKDHHSVINKPIIRELLSTMEFDYIIILDEYTYKPEVVRSSVILSEIYGNYWNTDIHNKYRNFRCQQNETTDSTL